jgi:hypothetical protein
MSEYLEHTSATDLKRFDFSKLPAGVYEIKNGEIVPVETTADDFDQAADNVTRALRKLLNE